MRPTVAFLAAAVVLLAAVARGRAGEPVALSGRAMGTTWTVKYAPAAAAPESAAIARRVAARLEELEQVFSTYRADSELSRFNLQRSLDWQPVSPELAQAADAAARWSALTGGAFDVTVAPLVDLWGFGPRGRGRSVPGETEIAAARARVGWGGVAVRADPPALRKDRADLAADFSSLAKGWAADAVAALLAELGAPEHFVALGGDIRTGGRHGEGWRVGIEAPPDSAERLTGVVRLAGEAVSTSGAYRNFHESAGRRYGHVIDPRTGRPVEGPQVLVSVVAASCATSSALATGLFVLGPEAGLRLAEREGIACLFLVREGGRLVPRPSPAFGRYLVVAEEPGSR